MPDTFIRIYQDALRAEADFIAETERQFGKHAHLRRYDPERAGWDDYTKAAGNLKLIADAKLHRAFEDIRRIAIIERSAQYAA